MNLKVEIRLKHRPTKAGKRQLVEKVAEALRNGLLRPINSDSNGISSFRVSLMLRPGLRCKGCQARVSAEVAKEFGLWCDDCLSLGKNFD